MAVPSELHKLASPLHLNIINKVHKNSFGTVGMLLFRSILSIQEYLPGWIKVAQAGTRSKGPSGVLKYTLYLLPWGIAGEYFFNHAFLPLRTSVQYARGGFLFRNFSCQAGSATTLKISYSFPLSITSKGGKLLGGSSLCSSLCALYLVSASGISPNSSMVWGPLGPNSRSYNLAGNSKRFLIKRSSPGSQYSSFALWKTSSIVTPLSPLS